MSSRQTISGFMPVRDVESQGYPFVEAAAAALLVCDEMLISDGHSTDRTWEGLLALREEFGDRVRLFRDEWPGSENRGATLAHVTNLVRRRCEANYCLSVQANEIIHEASAAAVMELASQHPTIEIFALPYLLLMGTHLASGTQMRRRLFRNVPDIMAVGDAFDVAGVLPVRRVPTLGSQLPEPVYRYRALSPVGYVAKLRAIVPRTRLWARELALAELALETAARASDPVSAFWASVEAYVAKEPWIAAGPGPESPRGVFAGAETAPAAAAHLTGIWRYRIEDSLDWLAGRGTTAPQDCGQ